MAKQILNVGITNNDKTGDTLRAGGLKIKSNFDEIYNALANDGLNISGGNLLKTGSYNDLTNKPSFATIATSGSYNDLTNKPTLGIFVSPPGNAQGDAGNITGNFAFDSNHTNFYVCVEDYVTQPLITGLTLISSSNFGYTFTLQYHTSFDPVLTAFDAGSSCAINPTVDTNWRSITAMTKIGTTVEVTYSGAVISNTSQLRIRVNQPDIWKTIPISSTYEALNTGNIGNFTFNANDATVPIGQPMTLSTYKLNANEESKLTLNASSESSLLVGGTLKLGTSYGSGYEKYWTLGSNGSITFPDATIQSTAGYTGYNDIAIALGSNSQIDGYAVAIGASAQADSYSVSIGAFAATKNVTNNTSYTIAIGAFAQQNNNPGDQTGIGAIAIGVLAGDSNQGSNAVAIGRYAGRNNQAAQSIVINATGGDLENTTSNTFVVKPVRGESGASLPVGFKPVAYNPTTGEFIYYDM